MFRSFQFDIIRVASGVLLIYFMVLFFLFKFNDLLFSQILLVLFILYIIWSSLALRFEKRGVGTLAERDRAFDVSRRKHSVPKVVYL